VLNFLGPEAPEKVRMFDICADFSKTLAAFNVLLWWACDLEHLDKKLARHQYLKLGTILQMLLSWVPVRRPCLTYDQLGASDTSNSWPSLEVSLLVNSAAVYADREKLHLICLNPYLDFFV
jgi:hypothetical protein